MARSRNIKPSIFKNELLGVDEANPLLTILFASLWCQADREGRLEDRPLRIKVETFPYRTISPSAFDEMLSELHRMGFILRYEIDGRKIIQVINFSIHQNPHSTERESILPEPPAEVLQNHILTDLTVKAPLSNGELTEQERSDSLLLIPDSGFLIPDSPPVSAKRKPRTDAKTKLPEDFVITDDMLAWAKENAPDVDLIGELAEFKTFWIDIATKNNKRTARGWTATWQNRMRELQKRATAQGGANGNFNGRNGANRKPTNSEVAEEFQQEYERLYGQE